jgi:hypothetical protein
MLRHTRRLLGTPVPPEVENAAAVWAPSPPLRALMDWLFTQYFVPEPPTRPRRGARLARWLLFMRSHWLRMPPLLLARHLTVKAWRRIQERFKRTPKVEKDV